MAEIAGSEFIVIDGHDLTPDSSDISATLDGETKQAKYFRGLLADDAAPIVIVNEIGALSVKIAVKGRLMSTQENLAAAQAALDAGSCLALYGYGRAVGARCLLLPAVEGALSHGGQVGEITPFACEVQSSGDFVRGQLFVFAKVTALAHFPIASFGAVASGKSLTVQLHPVGIGGTTPALAAIFETSIIGDYSDAVTRATFASFTDQTPQRIVAPGPWSATNGRFTLTPTGTGSPYFIVRAAAGIA